MSSYIYVLDDGDIVPRWLNITPEWVINNIRGGQSLLYDIIKIDFDRK